MGSTWFIVYLACLSPALTLSLLSYKRLVCNMIYIPCNSIMSREKCYKITIFSEGKRRVQTLAHPRKKQGPRRGPPECKSPSSPRHLPPPRKRAREKAEPSFAARGGRSLLAHSTP